MTDQLPGGRAGGPYADLAEEYLRRHFATLAAAAPVDMDFAGPARHRVTRKRRRRVAAVAATVLAAAVGLAVVWPGTSGGGPTATLVADQQLGDKPTGVLELNGVQVTVPASMLRRRDCRPPDVAFVHEPGADGLVEPCPGTENESARGSQVVMSAMTGTADTNGRLQRVDDGRFTETRDIDDRDVRVTVTSPSRRFIRQVQATIRVVPQPTPTGTPSASAAASTAESRRAEAMNAYLEANADYTALDAATPWGGRVFCATTLDSTSPDGDKLYAYALCGQVYVDDGRLTVGTASSGPVVFTAKHHKNATGDYVLDRITSLEWPRQQHLQADHERLFPPDVRERLPTGGGVKAPSEQDLFDRAQPELDAGRLGPGTPEAIAAAFLDFARANRDTIPVDTPVGLYLGNTYVRTIPAADVDQRASWQMCRTPYAQRDCPFSPLTVLDEGDLMPTITTQLPTACLETLADAPSNTGGSRTIALVPFAAPDCGHQYAVQIWSNDVGQITAVNLLLGDP